MHIIAQIFTFLILLIGVWVVIYPHTSSFKKTLEDLNQMYQDELHKAKQEHRKQHIAERQAFYNSKPSQRTQ